MSEGPSIVLAGGGTAGHINPMLAIAREIQHLSPDSRIMMVGTENSMEARLVPAAGFDIRFIPRVPMPRRPHPSALKFPAQFASSLKEARQILTHVEADVVVGVGGYVCTPMYLAAQALGIPVVIHEANAKPGLANRVGALRAKFVGTAFANTPIRHGQHVGMPMREAIENLDRDARREAARENLGLDADLPTLVVTGGSLGAQSMNETVSKIYPRLGEWGFQMLHITGRDKSVRDEQGNEVTAENYHQVEFITSMEDVYAAADLMVVRSGAATVSEVAAVGLPAIFVPLPIGNGEQALNARSLVDATAGIMIKDSEFTPEWFLANVPVLMNDRQRLHDMAQKSYAQGIRNAAHTMAQQVLKVAK